MREAKTILRRLGIRAADIAAIIISSAISLYVFFLIFTFILRQKKRNQPDAEKQNNGC